MDTTTLAKYRTIIKKVLSDYEAFLRRALDDNFQLIFDEMNDQYLLYSLGWQGSTRIYSPTIHLSLRNQKIWVEYDGTEIGVATLLLEEGVPHHDIVLGFYSPSHRAHTDFAAG